jgi:hypothetical protein
MYYLLKHCNVFKILNQQTRKNKMLITYFKANGITTMNNHYLIHSLQGFCGIETCGS